MRYEFIRDNENKYPVSVMSKVLSVSRKSYYDWQNHPESKRYRENSRILEEIKRIHTGRKRSYGSPRVHEELLGRGFSCNRKRVARLMREEQIAARRKRKFKPTTDSKHNYPIAANLLGQGISKLFCRIWFG